MIDIKLYYEQKEIGEGTFKGAKRKARDIFDENLLNQKLYTKIEQVSTIVIIKANNSSSSQKE